MDQHFLLTSRGLEMEMDLRCRLNNQEEVYCSLDLDLAAGVLSTSESGEFYSQGPQSWERMSGGSWQQISGSENELTDISDALMQVAAITEDIQDAELVTPAVELDGEPTYLLRFDLSAETFGQLMEGEMNQALRRAEANGQFRSSGSAWYSVDEQLLRRLELEATFPLEGQTMNLFFETQFQYDVPITFPDLD
jgi:hypothetical protein